MIDLQGANLCCQNASTGTERVFGECGEAQPGLFCGKQRGRERGKGESSFPSLLGKSSGHTVPFHRFHTSVLFLPGQLFRRGGGGEDARVTSHNHHVVLFARYFFFSARQVGKKR